MAALLTFSGAALSAAEPPVPARMPLWPDKAPDGNGGWGSPENSGLTVHPAPKPNGLAVVICPGGGYGGLVTGPEGHGIARWLNQHGIVGVVLEYRLPAGRSRVPLLDAQQALRTVRHRARDWGVNPSRVGIMGFSAGGHLAATASTRFDLGKADASDPVARQSGRPDFSLLIYPVVSLGELGHAGGIARRHGSCTGQRCPPVAPPLAELMATSATGGLSCSTCLRGRPLFLGGASTSPA